MCTVINFLCGLKRPLVKRVSLNVGVEHELSLYWGPVQNQILHCRVPIYARHLRRFASIPQAYQEKPLEIGLDSLPVFVFVWQ